MNPPTKPISQLEFPTLHCSLREGGDPKIHFTKQGVELDDDLTFDEYRDGLRVLKGMRDRSTLMLADYKRAGEVKFGKVAVDSAMGQLEFDMPTVNAIVDINSVPASLRKYDLSSDALIVLKKADLTPAKREQWARTAAEQNLSPSTLKASINEGEVVTPAQAKSKNHGIASVHGVRADFDIWYRRVGGLSGIMKMGEGYPQDILRELEPIWYLVNELNEKLAKQVK